MRKFTTGSLIVLFASLTGIAVAADRGSVSKTAGPGAAIGSNVVGNEGHCTASGRTYTVGMTACLDGSIRKCGQVVTGPKSKEVTSIGWVNQQIKCSP